MLRSRENYNVLLGVLGEHMKNKYNYEMKKDDLLILTNIMDNLTYEVSKLKEESMELYTEKINKMALNRFVDFKSKQLQQSQAPQRPQIQQQSQAPQRPQIQQQFQKPIETRQITETLSPPIKTQNMVYESNQIGNTFNQRIQNEVVTEQDIINKLTQDNHILEYEKDNLLKNQNLIIDEKNHYIKLLEDSEKSLIMMKSKMVSYNIEKGNVKKIIVNSDSNRQFHEGAFIYKLNHPNLYKIVLKSGYVECYNNFNILEHNNTLIIKQDDKEYKIVIEEGNYNIKELISILEDKITSKCKQTYILQYDETVNKVYIKTESIFSIIPSILSKLLGFDGLKEGYNIYNSDFSSKLHKNHSCFVRIKINGKNVGMVESTNANLKPVFAVMYDIEEKNVFSPKEEYTTMLETSINMETLSIEIVTDNSIYIDTDVFFQFVFHFDYN